MLILNGKSGVIEENYVETRGNYGEMCKKRTNISTRKTKFLSHESLMMSQTIGKYREPDIQYMSFSIFSKISLVRSYNDGKCFEECDVVKMALN